MSPNPHPTFSGGLDTPERSEGINSNSRELEGLEFFHDYRYTAARSLEQAASGKDWWQGMVKVAPTIQGLAEQYVEYCKDQNIVLENRETVERVVLPYTHRFHGDYQKLLLRRLRNIGKGHTDCVLMTLTTDPSKHSSFTDAVKSINQNWNKLLTVLRKKHGRVHYLRVLELTKSFLPHLHILIWGRKWIIKKGHLSRLWDKYGQGRIVDIRTVRANIASYLLKYIRKQWDKGEGTISAYGALMWACGVRQWSVSQGLIEAIPQDGEWLFLLFTDISLPIGRHEIGSETATDISYIISNSRG